MTDVFINVAVMNNVNDVLEKILYSIYTSGLYDYVDNIYLVINGEIEKLKYESREKYKVINFGPNLDRCEFPTLDLIWEKSKQTEDTKILYLHTKGVSKPNLLSISDWVDYLIYFNITKWRERINELNKFDCTGVDLKGNPEDIESHPSFWGYGKAPLHYSGNFWWSNSKHIKKLTKPTDWLPDDNYFRWRVMAEMWICQEVSSSYNCVYQSNNNFYSNRYLREKYEKS